MKNFLKKRYIILIINNYTIKKRNANVNILQDFSLFLILYLFYNANLLKMCNNIKLQVSITSFVNNINILMYRKSIKCNCRILS